MENNLDIKKLLGQRIKELRNKKRFTQETLAEMANITQRNLSKIECGKIFVTADTLAKIITALEVEAEDLFTFKPEKDIKTLKEEMIEAINAEKVDIQALYQLYKTLK